MSHNTEQNVRTFDTQISMMAEFIRTGPSGKGLEGWLSAHIRAAEARGAAEERRKDAEEVTAIYQLDVAGWRDVSKEDFFASEAGDRKKRILYSRPANVAALEARIAELQEQLGRLTNAASMVYSCGAVVGSQWPKLGVALSTARAALTREGGV